VSGNWTRNIPGISGGLEAIQRNGEAPMLQISNLHGDIIATATDSETATELASTIGEANEYGVPATEAPPKYSWLGAHYLPTQLPSGATTMGARSYIPQLGRFLQPDPSPGGSANAYAYTYGNPLNETDLSGTTAYNEETSGGLSAASTGEGTTLTEGSTTGTGGISPPPVNTQLEEAYRANLPANQLTAGTEEYEEYEEEEGEEWGEEYAAFGSGRDSHSHPYKETDRPEAQLEEGLIFQGLAREHYIESEMGTRFRRLPTTICHTWPGCHPLIHRIIKSRLISSRRSRRRGGNGCYSYSGPIACDGGSPEEWSPGYPDNYPGPHPDPGWDPIGDPEPVPV
jgi:RHS repeat-associated protein